MLSHVSGCCATGNEDEKDDEIKGEQKLSK